MAILLVGDPDDLTGAYVRFRAQRRGHEVHVLAEQELGRGWTFRFGEADRDGWLRVGERRVPFGDVGGACVRLNPQPPTDGRAGPAMHAFWATQRRAGLEAWLDEAPFPVANRLSGGRANASKPHQMRAIAALGLRVPEWVCANDAQAVRAFLEGCPDGAIYKSASGYRGHVRLLGEDLLARLDGRTLPVLVQRRIPGIDVRVHTVGGRCFATAAHGHGTDYRFEPHGVRYSVAELPPDIEEACLRLAEAEGLAIAGIDFRLDPRGDWWCLECNPVPTFLPYEMQTGQRIADALLDWMGQAAREGPAPPRPAPRLEEAPPAAGRRAEAPLEAG